jgi:hypothetical protein
LPIEFSLLRPDLADRELRDRQPEADTVHATLAARLAFGLKRMATTSVARTSTSLIAARIVGLAAIALAVAGFLLRVIGPATPQSFNIGSPLEFGLLGACAITYAVVGMLIARALPRHAVPWIFVGEGFTFAGLVFTWAYAVVGSSRQPPLDGVEAAALINFCVFGVAGLAIGLPLLHLFPSGRPIDRISRWSIWLNLVAAAALAVGVALTPGSMALFTGLPNPLAPADPFLGRLLTIAGIVGVVIATLTGLRSLAVRYTIASALEREQIRWFVWAGSLGAALAIALSILEILDPTVLNGPFEGVMVGLFAAAAAVLPIACAIAILRHGLYDIDRLISQTFVYGALLALIAGTYSAGLQALNKLVIAITGQSSDLATVLLTLVLAISFEPLKRRLTEFAKRFDKPAAPADASATVDDALVDAVAARVIEQLDSRQSNPRPT